MDGERLVARWEAKGGKRFVALYRSPTGYHYQADHGGGVCAAFRDDIEAIAAMTKPWGRDTGPVTVLASDFPSTKRVV